VIRKEMKKQKVIVLFAIALLLGVVVGGVQTVAVTKIQFIGNPVNGQWTKGTKFAGQPMEIMYWQKATKHLIDIHLDDSGYIQSVSFHQWGYGVPNITDALASQSKAKLPGTTPELITEAVYKRMINENISVKGPIDTSKIQYVGSAKHKEWVIGSKPKATNTVGSAKPSGGIICAPIAHGNTLLYWNKYTKRVIILKLNSEGNVNFVDFGLNGNRAVKTIPPSLASETISKLFP
jgi:hypothetical protein